MQSRLQFYFALALFIAVLGFCLYRDIQIEKEYTVDLRNRIVGARLQMDGKLPYFYRWQAKDGLRYYDPIRFDTTYANAITASPFFHDLLFPIANFQQRQISKIWLGIEYCMFIFSFLMALSFAKKMNQKWCVTIFASILIFTGGWAAMIRYGQIYLVFPFFCFIFVFCLQRKKNSLFLVLSGIIAAFIVLSRPTMILFFLPFLLIIKEFSKKDILLFLVPVLFLIGYNIIDKQQREYWSDYEKAIRAHIRHHQSADVSARNDAYHPIVYQEWEGWNIDSIRNAQSNTSPNFKLQFSGVQWIIAAITQKKISVFALNASCLILLIILLVTYFIKKKNEAHLGIITAAVFGFCLYMISDFFSPVNRSNYYAVQWIFPILLLAAYYDARLIVYYSILLLCLSISIFDVPFIKMRYAISEYGILFTFLWFCLSRKSKMIE